MLFIIRLKKTRHYSVMCFVTLSIIFNVSPYFCFAYPEAIINQLGSCFGNCPGGSAGEDCRSKCWGGYQMDLHPEIQEELNRKEREEELRRKKHEEEEKQKQEKPQEDINPEHRLKKINFNNP
ncbi:MAG: hypothetical protein BGO67_11160 [Alphaproteobacteria bacterium 41-28]|nr:MAG: hypothetical protein BGO67_11160 [Alphaproteobacteria bacterium 41-28]